jgi:hypothetical protein
VDHQALTATAAFIAGAIAATVIRLLPDEIDLLNALTIGAGLGAALAGGFSFLVDKDPGRTAAAGAALGMLAAALVVGIALLHSLS